MKEIIKVMIMITLPFTIAAQDVFRTSLYDAEAIIEFKEEIDLTEEQEKSIKDIYLKSNTVFMEKKWELSDLNKEMNQLLAKSSVNKIEAEKQLKKVLDLENEIKLLKFSTLIDIKNLLSKDQQEKLLPYLDESTGYFTSDIFMGRDYEVKVKVKEKNKEKSDGKPLMILENNGDKYFLVSTDINAINPSEIESIEVIKGERAESQYGERGKNGVIVISVGEKTFNRVKKLDKN